MDAPQKYLEKLTEDQLTAMGNDIYKAIYETVYSFETRGRNAHHFAQSVCEDAKHRARTWIKENLEVSSNQLEK